MQKFQYHFLKNPSYSQIKTTNKMRENSKRSINQIFIIYHETKTDGNSIAFQKLEDIVNIGVGTFYMDYYERGGET